MPKNTYNIVDWFLKHRDFSFDDYVDDEIKDKIKDQSSQKFFERGMDIAIKYAPVRKEDSKAPNKKESLRKLKKNTNMISSAVGTIMAEPKFNRNLDEFFKTKFLEP